MPDDASSPSPSPLVIPASETAERMKTACADFLDALDPDQRRKALFPFDDSERLRWSYLPRELFEHHGLPLRDMNDKQRRAAYRLLESGLSPLGYTKATSIMGLETILSEQERGGSGGRFARDPRFYFFTVFGDPGNKRPWAWRVQGHHVSLHYVVIDKSFIAPTPSFFGANPAEVRHGDHRGLRTLPREEDLARRLLTALDGDQKNRTIINASAPADIFTRDHTPRPRLDVLEGLSAESMNNDQRELFDELVREYVGRLPDEMVAVERKRIRQAGFNEIHFAWAGAEERGKPHYYRIHGPSFLVEYDNTQNNANHIHTVWRNTRDDFGLDLLALHYRQGGGHH